MSTPFTPTDQPHLSRLAARVADARCERGQTTAEYALVLIAAATIAMLIVAWAGNTGAINEFFDTIIDRITSMLP